MSIVIIEQDTFGSTIEIVKLTIAQRPEKGAEGEKESNGNEIDQNIHRLLPLAKHFDAHLTGLYLIPEFAPPATVGVYLTADINANVEHHERERADAAIDGFRMTAERQCVAVDTRTDRCYRSEFADMLPVHGRYADAVIIVSPTTRTVPASSRIRVIRF